jgi:hypothetical protein
MPRGAARILQISCNFPQEKLERAAFSSRRKFLSQKISNELQIFL